MKALLVSALRICNSSHLMHHVHDFSSDGTKVRPSLRSPVLFDLPTYFRRPGNPSIGVSDEFFVKINSNLIKKI
jgi:hypothetical protein